MCAKDEEQMPNYRFIKNAIAIACIILVSYLVYTFASGRIICRDSLQGTWISTCGQLVYTFNGSSFESSGNETSEFRIRGNRIAFSDNDSYHHIRVSREHIIIDGIVFLRSN